MMKNGDFISGFKVTGIEHIPEVLGVMYHMTHEKSGASVAYLDRDDRNMTFAIAFKTPPKDDTGVFHIIEHSVLCGSKKFPVKEPFVELLKGSLNTFLNALTYEDRTVYPVSSRCEKDFLNLTDIYLDAVFHPRMLEDKKIFMQEGWHFEYDENTEKLSYNGVVYNEMKGAYSSPDEVGGTELRRLLFPDGIYKYDSGGNPDFIPELTYEDFCRAHATYYHPSNSCIFLDGKMDIEKVFSLIDSYLCEYEKKDINVEYPIHAPTRAEALTIEYEPSGEPSSRILRGYVSPSVDSAAEDFGISVLCTALASTNESPLKRKMLDTGLCKDFAMSVSKARQNEICIEILGVKEEECDAASEALNKAIREIASEGIDKELLFATLNNSEFKLREKDFGSLPRGVAFALSAFGGWIYGKNPKDALCYEQVVKEVRERAGGDYFERLLLNLTVDNPHTATVIMHAKEGTLAALDEKREQLLKVIKSKLTRDDIERIKRDKEELDLWQNTPDSTEKLDTIPTLSLSDITPFSATKAKRSVKISGADALIQSVETDGIVYLILNFFADDLDEEELYLLSLISTVLKNVRTESYSASQLQNEIKSKLGALTVSAQTYPFSDGNGDARCALTVNVSVLKSNKGYVRKLLSEILLTSDFSDKKVIKTILEQLRNAIEDALSSDALTLALSRASSYSTRAGAINEIMGGYDAYLRTKKLVCDFDGEWDKLTEKLSSLLQRIAVRDRLLISVSGESDEKYLRDIIEAFPQGCIGEKHSIKYGEKSFEGLKTPTRVAYSALSALSREATDMLGTLRVLRSILSYEYLWNEIRVKGGAYGAGFIIRKSGEMGAYSYRDPSPAASLECFSKMAEYLRALAKSDIDLTKFIIGAVGEYDVLTTPKSETHQAVYDYLVGWSEDMEKKLREDMINTTKEDIRRAADIIERAVASASVCIAADGGTLSDKRLSGAVLPYAK